MSCALDWTYTAPPYSGIGIYLRIYKVPATWGQDGINLAGNYHGRRQGKSVRSILHASVREGKTLNILIAGFSPGMGLIFAIV